MKANAPLLALTVIPALVLAGCASQPRPAPQVPVALPAPRPRPPQPLPQPGPPPADWRDALRTPGDWRWSNVGGRSVATYGRIGAPLLTMACDAPTRQVTLFRPAAAPQATSFTITATSSRKMFTGFAQASSGQAPSGVSVAVPSSDPILDAMAFSRGRFMVESAGMATLYLPSWPEVSRVIEDCR